MVLDDGTLIGITIALVGSTFMMITFLRENMALRRRVRDLQVALRDERRK